METKEIKVGDRLFKVRELYARELDTIDWNDKANALKKQVQLSTELTDDEYDKLTVKERMALIKTMNELNGVADFQ